MNIYLKKRDLVYIFLAIALVVIFYVGRQVVIPFVMAAVFAYVLNPFVSFLNAKIKLPRTLAIILIYVLLMSVVVGSIVVVWARYSRESVQFAADVRLFVAQAEIGVKSLPEWLQPAAQEGVVSLRHAAVISPQRFANVLPGAVNRGSSFLIFLIAAFYFLKDGQKFFANFLNLLPSDLRFEAELISRKVNGVLGNYLRAQLLLVLIMSTLTFICLTIIGVRYALVLSIFTGLAETVPYVGPVVAALLAMIVAFTDNYSHFNIDPVMQVVIVGVVYTLLRQIEDLFIIPQVLGRTTKLHPLVILFSAFLGEHLFGVIGFLIAVPIVASLRVVLDHVLELLNTKAAKN